MKEILKKLKNLPWIKMAPYGGVVFGVAIFLIMSVTTNNDSKNVKIEHERVVTRFPSNPTYFFGEKMPESGIVLSWYDNTAKLKSGETTQLKLDAELYPITLENRELTFESSMPECAEIDAFGNITAKKTGSVEITVSNAATGHYAKAYLQVVQPVEGFYIHNSAINMYTTDTGIRVMPMIYPENASNTTVKWYSKDPNIVEVDQTGHLKAKSIGITEVVATTADGNLTAKCFVNVINQTIKVDTVSILNKDKAELVRGETHRLLVSVLPQNARNKLVTWESSDESILSVSKTGVIKGLKPGVATVHANSNDGAYDSFLVTVKESESMLTPEETPNFTMPSGVTYVAYDITIDEMVKKHMSVNPVYNDGNGLMSADEARTRQYIDPNEYSQGAYKYQFMDLSKYNGVSKEQLEKFLDGKGALSGQADAFIDAARTYNLSELYLIEHSCLETGYGTSKLATGVDYNGVRVYNMFGTGAYDYDAVGTGAKRAYDEGWTTPYAAIMGGAKWISDKYVHAPSGQQNTLYEMRWNPDNPGVHLYAGDIAWAVRQAVIMEELFKKFPDAQIRYEVPVYAGMTAPVIDTRNGMTLGR